MNSINIRHDVDVVEIDDIYISDEDLDVIRRMRDEHNSTVDALNYVLEKMMPVMRTDDRFDKEDMAVVWSAINDLKTLGQRYPL